MATLKQEYLSLCQQYNVDTQDCIVSQLAQFSDDPKKSTLDFSTYSLSPKSCAVLGRLLCADGQIIQLRFTDCMLTDEAVKALCQGLGNNMTVRRLDLKGNNIRANGAEALGRLVQKSTCLKSLCLDWNALGMLETSFAAFCECLSVNQSLTHLDLRNNQISHDGACELAEALKRNKTLLSLDLRWNNVGIIGGRALHAAMEQNKTLSKLELSGNNVPTDILRAIDSCVSANADRMKMAFDHRNRTQILSREIQSLKVEKQEEMIRMMDKLDNREAELRTATRSTSHRIGQLQEALEERKSTVNSLTAKLSLVESELALSESKLSDAQKLVSKLQHDLEKSRNAHVAEIKKEREDRQSAELKHMKENHDLSERNVKLEVRADELERKCKTQQEQVFDMKEQLAHAQADVKLKGSQYDERVQHEKHKFQDSLRELEQLKDREIAKAKEDAENSEKSLKDRIQRQEHHRLELEEEITRLKNQAVSDKLQHEDYVMTIKHKIRQEEDQRQTQMEEKCRLLQASKDELQSHCTSLTGQLNDLQAKHSQVSLENESLKCRVGDLQTELSGKCNEMMGEVGRVKMEYTQRIQRLEQERETQSDLYDKIKRLEKECEELRTQYRTAIVEKDQELHSLRDEIKIRDADIRRMREDEEQRAHMLQQAVMGYLRKSPAPQ